MSQVVAARRRTAPSTRVVALSIKALLVLLLVAAWASPEAAHLRGKAAEVRVVVYPMFALALPVVWWTLWRDKAFPWLADLLITITCYSDMLGNRLDLYDRSSGSTTGCTSSTWPC